LLERLEGKDHEVATLQLELQNRNAAYERLDTKLNEVSDKLNSVTSKFEVKARMRGG
jgi:uncharacterized protein YpuA (DUF1002 family)